MRLSAALSGLAIAISTALALSGCATAPTSEPTTTPAPPASSSSAPTTAAPTATTTEADLLSMEVPDYCPNFAPGMRLENGSRSFGADGGMYLAHLEIDNSPQPVFTDLNGDGVDEAVAFFSCHAGGVSWHEVLVMVGPGGALLD